MLDPLNAAEEIQTEVFFLANAGLFKNPVAGWILRKLYCIPIQRYEDTGGKPLNNKASFEQAIRHLAQGGCLYIAPEGTSYVNRRLRKLKTGTARIAFATESSHDFQLGLCILPVGLNYSDPTQFRSQLLTIIGEPIPVADFKEEWLANQAEAVRKMTETVAGQLASLLLDTADDEEDQVLRHLEELLSNEKPLAPYPQFLRSQRLLAAWQVKRVGEPAAWAGFSAMVFSYFEKIKALKINDLSVKNQMEKRNLKGLWITLLAAFPLFLLGFLTHGLPVFACKKISRALNKDIHWEPTFKFLIGFVVYPALLLLEIWALGQVLAVFGDMGVWVKWLFVLSILPSGLLAEWWWGKWKQLRQRRRAKRVFQQNPGAWKMLVDGRSEILASPWATH
jgi:1-acyl-sn-glycerol-3-phosphate acyltransferase